MRGTGFVNDDVDSMSFSALAAGDVATLAYWLGPCDTSVLHGADVVGIAGAMAFQYDVEEQADRTGAVIPDGVDWREDFAPVAPVQLTRAWSPLPLAVELLGPADWTSIEPDVMGLSAAACAWKSPRFRQPAPVPTKPTDQSRFHRLLALAVMRAKDAGRGVLVVAKPGWSYDDCAGISAETARLMRAVGFAVEDRHP
jgi:hypothetical protein